MGAEGDLETKAVISWLGVKQQKQAQENGLGCKDPGKVAALSAGFGAGVEVGVQTAWGDLEVQRDSLFEA